MGFQLGSFHADAAVHMDTVVRLNQVCYMADDYPITCMPYSAPKAHCIQYGYSSCLVDGKRCTTLPPKYLALRVSAHL